MIKINRVILLGRLVKDPVEGNNHCKFTVAVGRIKKDEADFINCIAFGKTAELITTYLNKGSQIAIEGRIQTGKFVSKDGETKFTTDVVVDRMEFVGGQKTEPTQNKESLDDHLKVVIGDELEIDTGDIPF